MDDTSYFYERAEAELKLAQHADHPAAVKAHYLLAGYYLDRVYGPGDDETQAMQSPLAPVEISEGTSALLR